MLLIVYPSLKIKHTTPPGLLSHHNREVTHSAQLICLCFSHFPQKQVFVILDIIMPTAQLDENLHPERELKKHIFTH